MFVRRILPLIGFAFSLTAGLNPGLQTCPSSGAKQVLATTGQKASTWTIQAPATNTGKIYIGNSTITTSIGVYLNAGDSASMPTKGNADPYDLSQIYIACTVTTDSITFTYFQ